MTSQQIKDLTHQYIMTTYGRFPVAIDHGQGATLYDPEGNAYIDFTSGIGVTDLGYGNAVWVDAVAEQAKKLNHVSNLLYTEPAARLVLEALGKTPLLTAGLHLGEGTGAVASIPLWDMALAVYEGCYSFAEGGIAPYTPQC